MKNSKFIFPALLFLLLLLALPSCQDPLLRDDAATVQASATPDQNTSGNPSHLNLTNCEVPVIRDFRVSSSCTRSMPCSNQTAQMPITMNSIRWRVGSDCGNFYYNGSSGTPVYQLYKYAGIANGTTCERFIAQGTTFSCPNATQFVATNTLDNNTRYLLVVSNVSFNVNSIYLDQSGFLYAGSCTNSTAWPFTDTFEFTTLNGKGLKCLSGPIEQPLPG